jgi:hypothetical protein
MTLCLSALVKRVAELREADLKACHCIEEFTLRWIHPLGHWEKLAFECPRLADPTREPADGTIFILQVLLVMICYSDLIHSFFCSVLTKTEIDRLVGHLFDKDPPVLRPNTVLMPNCTEKPPPLVTTITFFILHLNYNWYICVACKCITFTPIVKLMLNYEMVIKVCWRSELVMMLMMEEQHQLSTSLLTR